MSEEQSGSGAFDRQSAFRSLYQHMLEGVALHELVMDASGRPINYRILDVNPQYRRYVGIADANAVGRLATDAYGVPEAPHLAEFAKVAMTGEPARFEAYFASSDRFFDISVAPFGNLQFATIFLDVTERKRHEIALRDSEWFLRRSQHIARIGSFRMVIATGCWTGTDGLDEVFGIGREHPHDMEGWLGLVHPEDREAVHQHLVRDVMRDGNDFDRRYRIVRPCDGAERWVRVMGEVEAAACGSPVGIVGVLQDVTDNTLVEHALRASEERFRRIFDVFPEPLVLSDMEGNVVNCNDAFCAGVGCTRDEVIGKSPELVAAWGDHEVRRRLFAEIAERKAIDGLEFKFRRRDGQSRTMLLSARLFDISGRPVVLIAVRDVTDHRNLEQQMLHSQKLESLGVLAGGIAHDFNNLLTGILGNADLAKTEMSPLAPSRASLEGIEVAARRAADLCRQLLAYSGRGRFIIQRISVQELVEEMGHLLSVSISKKVVLKYHFAEGVPAVDADATQLRQVIMNLIVNASEAIGERSGVISITVGMACCDAEYLAGCFGADQMQPGDYVYLEVADTGHGMDKATLARVFDPFFSTKFTGRGLGLAAVLGIMRGHRGAIRVYSEPGRGTTFKLLLPASDGLAARLDSPVAVAPAYHASGKILLADDEETVRNLGRRMLQRAGFDVIVAADGREAIEKFAAEQDTIALVVLDLTMPHSDGEVCYREMRQLKPDVKVILSSGYNEQDIVNRFAGKGLSGFVQKPYTTEELLSKIREALG